MKESGLAFGSPFVLYFLEGEPFFFAATSHGLAFLFVLIFDGIAWHGICRMGSFSPPPVRFLCLEHRTQCLAWGQGKARQIHRYRYLNGDLQVLFFVVSGCLSAYLACLFYYREMGDRNDCDCDGG